MGKLKKAGVNEKAVEAKQGKEAKKSAQKDADATASEDAEWAAAGEGKQSKAQAKREADAARAAENAARKAEAKKLAAAEEDELASAGKKKAAAAATKASAFQLRLQREAEAKEREKAAAAKAAQAKRTVSEQDYSQIVELVKPLTSAARLVQADNVNRRDDTAEARSVEAAISVLSVNDDADAADRHPERRVKVAHLAFEETEIARLKEEKPGLRSSQYKDLAFKAWQKSPLNPLNQAARAAQQEASPKRK